jgi:hypothetical protein
VGVMCYDCPEDRIGTGKEIDWTKHRREKYDCKSKNSCKYYRPTKAIGYEGICVHAVLCKIIGRFQE